MREKEDGRAVSPRRSPLPEQSREVDEASPLVVQPTDTLREGYSWVHALESRYPGWRLPAVEGFPFTLPAKPVAAARVCLISLAGVYRKGQKPFNTSPGLLTPEMRMMRLRERGDWSVREIDASCDPRDLMIAHAHYNHEEADEDINCVFPLARLAELELDGFIGEAAPAHLSMMGYIPEATLVLQAAARELIPRLKSMRADGVVVSGACEFSHQSAALIQRAVEAAGISTVGVSTCADITYQLQVPRAVGVRFPMGNPFGAAMDASMQSRILKDALELIDTVRKPGEMVILPYEW